MGTKPNLKGFVGLQETGHSRYVLGRGMLFLGAEAITQKAYNLSHTKWQLLIEATWSTSTLPDWAEYQA